LLLRKYKKYIILFKKILEKINFNYIFK